MTKEDLKEVLYSPGNIKTCGLFKSIINDIVY